MSRWAFSWFSALLLLSATGCPTPGDSTPPAVSVSPRGGTYPAPLQVTLSCVDDAGGCAQLRFTTVDGLAPSIDEWTPYQGAIELTASATLRFFAVDAAGNQSDVGSERYTLVQPEGDTVAPVTTASPAGGTFAAPVEVSLDCFDLTGCQTWFTTDGSEPSQASTPYGEPLLLSVTTTLRFFSVDPAGNVEAVKSETWVIDSAAPTTSVSPAAGPHRPGTSIVLACDDGAGVGCAGTWFTVDGSVPTRDSPRYAGPLSLEADLTLRFFSADALGNEETLQTVTYVLDGTPPVTTALPAANVLVAGETVTLRCEDTNGCRATYFTVDGTSPSAVPEQLYAGPFPLFADAEVRYFSVDQAGNVEVERSAAFFVTPLPADISEQLRVVREDLSDGAGYELRIDGAYVTYLHPSGFFLQAEQHGPALFIAEDPSALQIGDRLEVLVEARATVDGVIQAEASSIAILDRGHDVEPLRQDVSAVELTGNTSLESELLAVRGTISGAWSPPSAGLVTTSFVTGGNPSPSAGLLLRVPQAEAEARELQSGCEVTLHAPHWRTDAAVALTAWRAEDLVEVHCPFELLAATPTSETSLELSFSRKVEAASLLADGSQFTANNGLTVTGATGVDNVVTLTTSAQGPRVPYVLGIDPSLTDRAGTPLQAEDRTVEFGGFEVTAILRLEEVSPRITGGRDLIELKAVSGGGLMGLVIAVGGTTAPLFAFPAVSVDTGDLILVHFGHNADLGDAPGSETSSQAQHPSAQYSQNSDQAWDLVTAAAGPAATNVVLRVDDRDGATQDGVAFVAPPATTFSFPPALQYLQAVGAWQPQDCQGVLCSYTSYPSAYDVSVNWSAVSTTWGGPGDASSSSAFRISSQGDQDLASDWMVGPSSLGLPNP